MSNELQVLKQKAISLRLQGLSYGEIKAKFNIPKSTLSGWLKNVPLTEADKMRLYTKQIKILSLGPQSQKERRRKEVQKIIRQASCEIQRPLSTEVYRLMGAALYWAEGSKGGRFCVTNSDPYFILFMTRWLERIFNIPPNNLRAWLNIYSQQSDVELKEFWSDLTGIPVANFGKSYIKPTSSGYKKNNLYYGTLRVEVPKSTDIKHKVFGWIQAALSEVEAETKFIQRKWQKLAEIARPVNV